ncbi:AAA family ATPase [Micromonospora zingiberis]|uniref:AAA family ATPase n=1 Tax=Micromonospora zingiberis TaxID=2053011 RepID=A0A4R0GAN9_9ACTN|nr:AAA family ATPase [Micromonospora zingiberis]TCB92061.1 AAA family ATPase [Micromonospora zingiberis]
MPPHPAGLNAGDTGDTRDREPVHGPAGEPVSDGQAAHGESAEHGRRILLTPASAIKMRPVAWTWTDRIPSGALTVIPGREGIGKSLTLAWLTAQITRGVLPGRHHGTPRPVIYAATEDSWAHTIGPRLLAAGADLDMVYRVDVQHDGGFDALTLPRDCAQLGREIQRLGVALLAADPLLSLIHSAIDTHRDRDLRTALEPLVNMADRTGCAVVGLAHFNKSASPDALNLITGSRAFSAVARAVIAIARDDEAGDGSCVMSQAKNNLGRLDLPSLRYVVESVEIPTEEGPAFVGKLTITGESARSVGDILGDGASDGDTRSERDAAAAWLRDYLISQGGEAAWADVRKAARAEGIAERTIQRARTRAGVTIERHGFPSRTVWCLNPGHPASPAAPVTPQSRQSRQLPERGATGATGSPVASLPIPGHVPSPR